jgi:uncharacterized protein (DUF1330 family)
LAENPQLHLLGFCAEWPCKAMPARTVILEFPDTAAALRWYRSPEYQAALPIRIRASEDCVFLFNGLSA